MGINDADGDDADGDDNICSIERDSRYDTAEGKWSLYTDGNNIQWF